MMILIKGLRDNVQKALKTEVKERQGKETREEALERFEKETKVKANAREQVTSLLSFKEALSTGTGTAPEHTQPISSHRLAQNDSFSTPKP
jgi:hypothetical protein